MLPLPLLHATMKRLNHYYKRKRKVNIAPGRDEGGERTVQQGIVKAIMSRAWLEGLSQFTKDGNISCLVALPSKTISEQEMSTWCQA